MLEAFEVFEVFEVLNVLLLFVMNDLEGGCAVNASGGKEEKKDGTAGGL